MKKIAFVFTFFLLLTVKIVAQPVYVPVAPPRAYLPVRIGFSVSPTWSWISTDDKKLLGVNSDWGIKLNLNGEFYFTPNYAFITGMGFAFNQGGRIQNGYDHGNFWPNSVPDVPALRTLPTDAKMHYRLTYFEVPFGIKMRGGSNENSPFKFYAELPVFTLGVVTKSQGDITGTSGLASADADKANDINISGEVHKLSLSLGAGGGIEYELATHAFLVAGLAYHQQLTDFTSNNSSLYSTASSNAITDKSKATIRSIVLRIGIFF
jgi:hypothetical protein